MGLIINHILLYIYFREHYKETLAVLIYKLGITPVLPKTHDLFLEELLKLRTATTPQRVSHNQDERVRPRLRNQMKRVEHKRGYIL